MPDMADEPGRLARIERKLDTVQSELTRWRVQSEHRFTKLESTAKAAGRWAGMVWGIGASLLSSLALAYLSKHL